MDGAWGVLILRRGKGGSGSGNGTRIACLALVLGLLCLGMAQPAQALGSPVLVSIAVSPTTASVAAGDTEQFTATGTYSNLTQENITGSVAWSASGDATISNASGSKGLATGVSTGVVTIKASDPSALIDGTAVLTITSAVLVSVSVSPTTASVAAGDIEQFTATATYSNLTTANVTNTVTWSASNGDATVSNASGSQGLATGVSTGVVTIMASDPSALLDGTAVLTITPAVLVAVTMAPAAASVAEGQTQQFTATGIYSNLTTADLTDSVTWSASSGDATISNASGSQGLATGVSTGVVTITATDPSSLIDGTAVLTVGPAVLVAVAVSPPSGSVAAGDTEQFTATGIYSNLGTADLTDSVTWSSSNGDASISNAPGSQGLATGVSNGVASITATDPTSLVDGAAVLTVLPAVLVSLSVAPPSDSVATGQTQQFTATGTYSNLQTANLTGSVTWSSSGPDASISNASGSQGLATGVHTGTVTITATDPSTATAGTAQLAVTANAPTVTISPSSGGRGAPMTVSGTGFTSGLKVTVTYDPDRKKLKGMRRVLCHTNAGSDGTFSCTGRIPPHRGAGRRGVKTITATEPNGTSASTTFTLT